MLELVQRSRELTFDFEYHHMPITTTWWTPRFPYEEAPYYEQLNIHIQAASAACTSAVISGLAAATIHGIPTLNLKHRVVVNLTPPGKKQPPSQTQWPVVFHYRYADLPPADITIVGGCRVTTLERTFLDICTINGTAEGLAFVEAALNSGRRSKQDFQIYLDAHRGSWGVTKAQKVLDLALYGIDSVYESLARHLLMVELPHMQVNPQALIPTPGKYGRTSWRRVDLFINNWLIAEIDGKQKYLGNPAAVTHVLTAQVERQNHIMNYGYHFVRLAPADLHAQLIPTVKRLIGQIKHERPLDKHRVLDLREPPYWMAC